MSSEKLKLFYRSRVRFFCSVVAILWLLQTCFLGALLLLVKQNLRQGVEDDLRHGMSFFVSKNHRLLYGPQIFGAVVDEKSLGNLDFVRIIRGDEQLLFSTSTLNGVDFTMLSQIDPSLSGVWLPLTIRPDQTGDEIWNISAATPAENLIVQVGSRDHHLFELYQRMKHYTMGAIVVALVVAVIITQLGLKLSLLPLNRLANRLASIKDGADDLLDDSSVVLQEQRQVFHQLNEIILQNRKLVNEMQASLDNVAHDLRTPMTRLRSVAEYGIQAGEDHEKLREALADCLEETERVLAMLNTMMNVAEAESGTMQLAIEPVRLCEMLRDIVELYEYAAEEATVTVDMACDERFMISVDRTRFSQVIANLLDNAIKYNKANGRVTVTGRDHDEFTEIVFEDSGIGVSEQEKYRIWDRLYRGDRSRTKPGLGLGLNYVNAVVKAHGGTITMGSVLNEGTTFTIRLPKSADAMEWDQITTS
ncbi:MAG: sensor histidine kinase [Desulfobulbaceae bacterium]|nr:MAG: sensor histidine kinase [Desulfobulbaceae bacterium]